MAVDNTMDPLAWLRKHLETDGGELLAAMLQSFAETLMAAEAQAMCNTGFGEVSGERTNSRNGYRPRPFDARAGSMELKVPKLRRGSYLPDWLSPRAGGPSRPSPRSSASATSKGCPPARRRPGEGDGHREDLKVPGLGVGEEPRRGGRAVPDRPSTLGPTYVWVDALTQKVREGGRIVNVAVVIATAVNVDGHREVLGLDVITTEDGAGWLAFLAPSSPGGSPGSNWSSPTPTKG